MIAGWQFRTDKDRTEHEENASFSNMEWKTSQSLLRVRTNPRILCYSTTNTSTQIVVADCYPSCKVTHTRHSQASILKKKHGTQFPLIPPLSCKVENSKKQRSESRFIGEWHKTCPGHIPVTFYNFQFSILFLAEAVFASGWSW